MTPGPDQYFILVYEGPSGALEIHEFGRDYEAAVQAYNELETKHGEDGQEVVLVGADSLETIRTTHSHYFAEQADDLFRQFLDIPAGRTDVRVEPRSGARTQRRRRLGAQRRGR